MDSRTEPSAETDQPSLSIQLPPEENSSNIMNHVCVCQSGTLDYSCRHIIAGPSHDTRVHTTNSTMSADNRQHQRTLTDTQRSRKNELERQHAFVVGGNYVMYATLLDGVWNLWYDCVVAT